MQVGWGVYYVHLAAIVRLLTCCSYFFECVLYSLEKIEESLEENLSAPGKLEVGDVCCAFSEMNKRFVISKHFKTGCEHCLVVRIEVYHIISLCFAE